MDSAHHDADLEDRFRQLPAVHPEAPRAGDARWYRHAQMDIQGRHRFSGTKAALRMATLAVMVAGISSMALIRMTPIATSQCSAQSCPGKFQNPNPSVERSTSSPPLQATGAGNPAADPTPTPGPTPTPSPNSAAGSGATPQPNHQAVQSPSPTPAACPQKADLSSGTVTPGNNKSSFYTPTGDELCATLVWHGSAVLGLKLYNGDGTVLYAQAQTGTSPVTLQAAVTPGQSYKVKVETTATSGSSTFTLTVNA